MNILVVMMSPLNNLNSANIRTIAVAKGLIQLDHEVTFLSLSGSSGTTMHNFESDDDLKNATLVYTKRDVLKEKVWRNPKDKSFKGRLVNLLRKIFHKISVLDSSRKTARQVNINLLDKEYYDIIISSSDPKTSHVAMHSLIKSGLTYGKWIEYWGDPLVLDITQKSMYPKWILKKIESKLFHNADSIVYVSPITLNIQKQLYPKYSNKMSASFIPYIRPKYYSGDTTGTFHISYIGAYESKVRNIIPLHDALHELGEGYSADIVGDSDLNLETTSRISISQRESAEAIEAKSNLLVCLLNLSGTQIPGKIYHCASTNLPILIITDGDYADQIVEYLSKFNRFNFCCNSKKEIYNSIKVIEKRNKEEKPCEEFSPMKVAKVLIE